MTTPHLISAGGIRWGVLIYVASVNVGKFSKNYEDIYVILLTQKGIK